MIAYLHLILLMCVCDFLLSQVIQNFKTSPRLNAGLKYFLLSVFLNEFLLGLMGIFSIKYVAIPFANEFLFGISVLILISILIIFNTLKEKTIKPLTFYKIQKRLLNFSKPFVFLEFGNCFPSR